MKLTCLSKTMINEGDEVRLLVIADKTIYSKDFLMSTYKTDDQFSIVGLPLKAKLTSGAICQVPDSLEADFTIDKLKKHMHNVEEFEENFKISHLDNIWDFLQDQIYNGKVLSKYNKRKGHYQIALIDENVYQMCLKQDILSWLGINYKQYNEKLKNLIKESIENADDSYYQNKIKKAQEDGNEDLVSFYKETALNNSLNELNDIFSHSFSSSYILSESITNNVLESLISSDYVLNVLNENGCYIMPTNSLSDGIEQTAFTKLLLKDQIAQSVAFNNDEYEDGDNVSPDFPKYEYVISLLDLKRQIRDWYGEYKVRELTDDLEVGTIVSIYEDSELAEIFHDTLPSYVKKIKIIGE